jgi:hypothetical protein
MNKIYIYTYCTNISVTYKPKYTKMNMLKYKKLIYTRIIIKNLLHFNIKLIKCCTILYFISDTKIPNRKIHVTNCN